MINTATSFPWTLFFSLPIPTLQEVARKTMIELRTSSAPGSSRTASPRQFNNEEKAQVQLLLAQNYYKAGNYDIARNEYLSVTNQYKDTKEATEAKFGVGETYMSQKIYDKAQEIFDDLANSRFHRIMIRAEFLRGVLAHRQEDSETARKIFRNVLERMPDAELDK